MEMNEDVQDWIAYGDLFGKIQEATGIKLGVADKLILKEHCNSTIILKRKPSFCFI